MQDKLVVYGAEWCPDTQRTRHSLESMGVPYRYVDVERDEDANERVKQWNGGRRVTPTVVLPTGGAATGEDRLAAPSDRELEETLRDRGLGG
jgi:glutaredoxin